MACKQQANNNHRLYLRDGYDSSSGVYSAGYLVHGGFVTPLVRHLDRVWRKYNPTAPAQPEQPLPDAPY